MRILRVIAVLFVLAASSGAQRNDVRVRLFTLFHLKEITIEPVAGTTVQFGRTRSALQQPLRLVAERNTLTTDGRPSANLVINGEFRVFAENAPNANGQRPTAVLRSSTEVTAGNGELRVITTLPMEQYVAAALEGETSGEMPSEALKAMAVAVRSYATHFHGRHQAEGFDFCDTTHCQHLRLEAKAAVEAAVQATRGELLWDHGTPLAAYYHQDCGGHTEAAETAWPDEKSEFLVSRADPYCSRPPRSWRSEIKREDLQRALTAAGVKLPAEWNTFAISEHTPSGRARTLRFFTVGTSRSAIVSASTLRFAVGQELGWNVLKSDLYTVEQRGNEFVFTGRGGGHGIGLCQVGAAEMAREGKTYREILAFYYNGAPIGRNAQGIAWQATVGEQFDLRVVNDGDAEAVRAAAREAIAWAQERSGLALHKKPVIEAYPTVSIFRDSTGEPGWVAASTRGERIRLEPLSVLGPRLAATLRHELLHMMIEGAATNQTPLWFREGLVVYLGDDVHAAPAPLTPQQIDDAIAARRSQAEVQSAYAAAAALVGSLERRYGRTKLMEWLRSGLPKDIDSGK